MATTLGAVYIAQRAVATSASVDPRLSWPLLVAEVIGYMGFVVMVIETWHLPMTTRRQALDVRGRTTVYCATTGAGSKRVLSPRGSERRT